MSDAFICDAIRTPIGRYGGSLAKVRADDLAARPIAEILSRNGGLDPKAIDDLYYGCANQAGEDNRNVARMAGLLAGLPVDVPACTVNRLCGSGMDAIGLAARSIKTGEASLVMAGGVESMSRAPLVIPKQETAFGRRAEMFDTTMGWRFINPLMQELYGVDSMPETGENVAEQYSVSRADQDAFAFASQQRVVIARKKGFFAHEIIPVSVPQRRGDPLIVDTDEHPRADTSLEKLSLLPTPFRTDGTVTAGNASGINDGACALLLASGKAARKHGLKPLAKVVGMAVAGVEPRIMCIGPLPAIKKVLAVTGLELAQMDVIEINEAFAAQSLAVIRVLGLPDDAAQVNPNGGAIALGHPLGMTGARLVTTAAYQLRETGGHYALCTVCVGVGQGIAMIIESV